MRLCRRTDIFRYAEVKLMAPNLYPQTTILAQVLGFLDLCESKRCHVEFSSHVFAVSRDRELYRVQTPMVVPQCYFNRSSNCSCSRYTRACSCSFDFPDSSAKRSVQSESVVKRCFVVHTRSTTE